MICLIVFATSLYAASSGRFCGLQQQRRYHVRNISRYAEAHRDRYQRPQRCRTNRSQVVEDEGFNVNRQADQQGIRGHWCQQRHWGRNSEGIIRDWCSRVWHCAKCAQGPSSTSHGVCGPVKARRYMYLNNHSVILLTCTTAIHCGKQMQS